MRKINIIFGGFFLMIFFCGEGYADLNRQPTKKILEYSLRSLRDSVLKVANTNAWLADEIKRLEQEKFNIDTQYKKLKGVEVDWQERTGQVKNLIQMEFEQVHILDKEKEYLLNDFVKVKKYYQELYQNFEIKQKEVGVLEKEFNVRKLEIVQLNNEIETNKYLSEDEESNPERMKFLRQIEDAQRRIEQQEKHYKKLKKKPSGNNDLTNIKIEKNSLLQKIAIVKDELVISKIKEESINQELKKFSLTQDEHVGAVDIEIEDLSFKHKELTKVILDVKKKIVEKDVNLNVVSIQQTDMKRNLDFIMNENHGLKEDLHGLKESFESLTKR
jgi:chromosome segregation ATPase